MRRTRRCASRTLLLSLLGAAGVSATAAAQPASQAAAHTYTVTIEGVQFHPQALAVHRGDRIVWINKDPFPHTVTAVSKLFDSKPLAPEASWTYVAAQRGEYPYFCQVHPTMKARIVVQ